MLDPRHAALRSRLPTECANPVQPDYKHSGAAHDSPPFRRGVSGHPSAYDASRVTTLVEENEMEFVDVCALDAVAPGASLAARVGGRDVALFNVEGTLHAIENSCLHAGASLAGGSLCGRIVACRAHGWRYDVTTGALVVAPSRGVARFPVQVAEGRVLVAVTE